MVVVCSVYLVSNRDDFVRGLRAVAAGIVARKAELKKLMAEKDATIAENVAALAKRDDIIGKLEALVPSSAGTDEINELKSLLTLAEAEKEFE